MFWNEIMMGDFIEFKFHTNTTEGGCKDINVVFWAGILLDCRKSGENRSQRAMGRVGPEDGPRNRFHRSDAQEGIIIF